MILSSWERGDEIQPKYEYFEELVEQLKELVREEKRNLMVVTRDIFLCAKLWRKLGKIEKISKKKRERVEKRELRTELTQIQNLIDHVVEGATEQFSFTLNQVVAESVKIVQVEKSQVKNIEIHEQLDEVGNSIRFSYDRFKDWQRILTNLIRNAVDAVEIKQSREGVVARFIEKGGGQSQWVRISAKLSISDPNSVSICIEDSGIGMDEAIRLSFFKKGFTSGKEGGLGLGVSEESVQLINNYGSWQVKSKKGVGTKITINIDKEKAQKAELILPPKKPFPRTKLAWGLSFLVLALIGLALLFAFNKYSRFWVDWNPATVERLDENTMIVKTKGGKPLWNREFPQRIGVQSPTVADLNKDGRNEVLIGTWCGFKETGRVYCFSFDGQELWQFAPGANEAFGKQSDRYIPGFVLVKDLNLDGEVEILVGSANTPYFAFQIAVLNRQGKMEQEYWHTGSGAIVLCNDIDGDSIPEIVFGGVNNRLGYSAVLGVLDYRTLHGQSPPYTDEVFSKGNEKVYVKFPFVKGLGGENSLYSSVTALLHMGKENGCDVFMVQVCDYRDFIRDYYLDETLTNVKSIVIKPTSHFVWQNLKKEGIVDYDITPEVIESWKHIEVWKSGVKVK